MILKKLFYTIGLLFLLLTVTSQNIVSTYAGDGYGRLKNGQKDTCSFSGPWGMCRDKNNNLYVADAANNCIRKINMATGIVTNLAGSGVAGWKDGRGDTARFHTPIDLCADDSGNVYVTDFDNQRIRKISYTGLVTTIAGNTDGLPGYKDGPADTARFDYPRGICRDAAGNLYVGDSWNHRIRKISPGGTVSTFAGGGTIIGVQSVGTLADGQDTSARFYVPTGLNIDASGNIYVADSYNHRIRKVSSTGAVTTIAGSGPSGETGAFIDGDTSIARFNTPTELCYNATLNKIYVGDLYNYRIRQINLDSGTVSTFAGDGTAGYNDTADSHAEFNMPRGITIDTSDTKMFVADFKNNVIRSITIHEAILNGIELPLENNVLIFPNPFCNEVSLYDLPSGKKEITLFDVSGKELKHWVTVEKNITLNLIALQAGAYLLSYTDGGQHTISKNIVKIAR